MNRLLALVAFVVLLGFVGILAVSVPSPDLIAVIALTVALVGYDFLTSNRNRTD